MQSTRRSSWLRRGGAFLVVGLVAFIVDAVTFNLLTFGLTGFGPFYELPVVSKLIAIGVATIVTYVGNRYWTYRTRALERRISRYVLFAFVNVVAVLLQLGCLAFSRYVLGLEGVVPDNISGTLVGQAVATVFRFWTYDRWVFRVDPRPPATDEARAEDVR